VTTPFEVIGLKLTVRLGLTLTLRDGQAISRLDWAKIGFLTLPAAWLPAESSKWGRPPGEIITQQIPQVLPWLVLPPPPLVSIFNSIGRKINE